MRFKSYIEILSNEIQKIGWYIVKYEHWIDAGEYNIQFQKIVHKRSGNGEPFQIVITHNIIFDELNLFIIHYKELIRNVIRELGDEDVKA